MNEPQQTTNKNKASTESNGRTCPERFTIVAPIPFQALMDKIEAHTRCGLSSRALGEAGGRAKWSGTTVYSAMSDLRTGLIHAAMATLPEDERSAARGVHALTKGTFAHDVRPLLPHVATAVAALRTGADSRRVAANRTSRLLAAFVAGLSDRSPAQVQAAMLNPAWQHIVLALQSHTPAVPGSLITGVMHLARAGDAAGLAPSEVPEDAIELARFLERLLPNKSARHAARSALRRLSRLEVRGVPRWPAPSRRNAAHRLAEATVDHLKAAEALVPALAALAQRYAMLRQSGQLKSAPTTAYGREMALYRACTFAARAVEAGIIPGTVAQSRQIWDWWSEPVTYSIDGRVLDAAAIVTDDLLGSSVDDEHSALPALVACFVWAARTGMMAKAQGEGELPRSVLVDAQAVWYAAQEVATAGLGGRQWTPAAQALVDRAKSAHERACRRLGEELGPRLTAKDKAAAIRMGSLPLVVAMYLPWWTLVELPRREAALNAVRTRIAAVNQAVGDSPQWAPGEHHEERRALAEFEEGIEAWLALAIGVADPLRIKNQWAARIGLAGTEYLIHADFAADGSLAKLRRVSSQFGGKAWATQLGNQLAALKTGKYPDRQWDLANVALCPHWFGIYLEHVWLPRLRRQGVISSTTSLREALAMQRFPLWVADPDAQRGLQATPPLPGGYATEQAIRRRFRRGFLAGLRAIDAFSHGLVDQPIPDDDEEAARIWPWLLCPHIARLWWATHCLGVLAALGLSFRRRLGSGEILLVDPVQVARRATTDRETTMRQSYDAATDLLRQLCLRDTSHWRHPLAPQAEALDLLCAPDVRLDWAAVWGRWATATRTGEAELLPSSLLQQWERRHTGNDACTPALRRPRRTRSTEARERAA